MLVITGFIFAVGVALFIIDFFRFAPRCEVTTDAEPILKPVLRPAVA